VASPAYAAVNSYMRIEGTEQGPFKGEPAHQGSDQWIPIMQFNQSMQSPRDSATGQASGKRRHEPIKITKEWGAASPQLQRALATNEVLKEVVFEFVRTNARGREEVYETIKLTNALVTGIQRGAGQRTGKNTKRHGGGFLHVRKNRNIARERENDRYRRLAETPLKPR
jgi:type VI secretion system secreted protein Hcp